MYEVIGKVHLTFRPGALKRETMKQDLSVSLSVNCIVSQCLKIKSGQ